MNGRQAGVEIGRKRNRHAMLAQGRNRRLVQYFRASEPPGIVILLQKLRSRIMQDHVNQSNSD
jgi:hypothetical protein